jgi:Neuraminidase-like domain/Salmonella virulence plasmid 28.1kDa A protein
MATIISGSVPLNFNITGTVVSSNGAAVPGLTVIAYDRRVSGDIALGQGVSDANGKYTISYSSEKLRGMPKPDIEVRAMRTAAAGADQNVLGKSEIRYNADSSESINVIIPESLVPRASEYERLIGDIQPLAGTVAIKDLQENENNTHITLLSNKTGWDGRAVAMAAQANKLSATTGIPAPHYYALFRAGLPADDETLSRLPSSSLQNVLEQAAKDKVIPQGNIDETLKVFNNMSTNYLLRNSAAIGVSNLGTMLALRLNGDQQNIFAESYREAGGSSDQLWSNLKAKGIPSDTISKLQLDGKLGFLTFQNAPLIKRLYDSFQVSDPADLIKKGLYKTEEWKKVIGTDLPKGISADDYATSMVNLLISSYPTAVVAEMVHNSEVKLTADIPKDEVYNFFSSADQKTVLGETPVKQWDTYKKLKPQTQSAVKQVERMYQLTPSNASMSAISSQGISSAYQIVQYSRDEFLQKYGNGFPSQDEASMTYTRAQEVYSATTNIANAYISYRINPNVYTISGKTEITQADIIEYPTMEGLFGNFDYCSCDECKSVLGAAAYLVDLLHFIDLSSAPHDLQNPLDVLLSRRPDIQHLQLTCENTNTVLPYIDIVNEILEFYIANGSLAGFTGHNIAEGTDSNDLLADPQYVITTAYDKTNGEVYPLTLPFDRAREALRLFFKAWDSTQEQALRIFISEISARKERLGLNQKEYDILSNIASHQIPEYFGEAPATTIDGLNAAIANGKVFTIRTDITDEDLVEILETAFINPGSVLVPELDALQIGADKIQAFYDGTLSDADLNNLLPATLDKTPYDGNVGQWLKDNQDLISRLIVLTDMTPDTDDCNLAEMELRYLLPPDVTKNKLDEIAYQKLHRFIRLWKKLAWKIDTTDKVITALIPTKPKDLMTANIDAAFVTLLARLANFSRLMETLSLSEKSIPNLLPLWDITVDIEARQTQAAQLFKMRIEELLDISKITGLDPLVMNLESDFPDLIQLLQVVADLKRVPLKIADLSYLLMNKDSSNKLTPDPQTLLKEIKQLHDALRAVEKDNTLSPDNADLSFAKAKLSLVYDSSVVDTLFSLLTNNETYSAPLALPEEALPATLSANPQLGYDAFKKTLTYTGVMTAAAQTDLNNKADALTLADMTDVTQLADLNTFKNNFKGAVQIIKTDSDTDIANFASGYPELKVVYDNVLAQPTPAQQTSALINGILPALIGKLKINALQLTLASITSSDAEIINALTGDQATLHSVSDITKNILNDFSNLEGIFDFNNNQTYDGYLDPPASDDYILYVRAPQNTTVTLSVNAVVAINNVLVGAPGEVQTAVAVTLQAGLPAPIRLVIANLPAGKEATIWWRTKGMAKAQVPDSSIYIQANVDNAMISLQRLVNAVYLQQLLQLTAPELSYFAGVNPGTKDFLNNLPASNTIDDPALHSLWQKIYLLIFFALLKKDTEQDEGSWLQILKQPNVTTPQGKVLLLDMNGWQQADVDAILAKLGKTWNDISDLGTLRKLTAAMALVISINFPAASVINWSVENPDNAMIDSIKTAIRSKTDDAAWLDSMQSISDIMRNLQRDALIAYILHHLQPAAAVDTADKLFEYFLIDVQMDACMETSRIVQATATVQLFIYRCLMNLEPTVSPASIKSDQWEWMQRYRVWQANRKIFLYPENWLDPELRDGKSSFYQDLEGQLMQADITQDLAEAAYLDYLKKLDDVARLEIVGMYLQENEAGNGNDDILHLFGRTNGHTRQYYYRKFESGYWTAWEKVGLSIEGDHIYPVIWKSRLFLFWLNTVEKAQAGNRDQHPRDMADANWGDNQTINVEINMVWGEYYKGKWTSPKSSENKDPIILTGLASFDARNILLYATKEQKDPKLSEHLIFYLIYTVAGVGGSYTFTSKNCPPILNVDGDVNSVLENVALFNYELFRVSYEGSTPSLLSATTLTIPSSQIEVLIDQPELAASTSVTEVLFTKSAKLYSGFRLLPIRHIVENQWQAPFVYLDERSVFLAQPTEVDTPPLWRYLGYYDIGVVAAPTYKLKIPPMVEKPVFVKPIPRGYPDTGQPAVDPSPWEQVITSANNNYKSVLPSIGSFKYDQASFGVGGKVPAQGAFGINMESFKI